MDINNNFSGSVVNGVDTKGLRETCALLEREPTLGNSQFRLHNTWKSGGNNRARIKGFYTAGKEQTHKQNLEFEADEPVALLGSDNGASPVEYLLTALASCMTTSIVYHAAAKGIEVKSIESDYIGDLDLRGFLDIGQNVPIGYQRIKVIFDIESDAPKESFEGLYLFSPVYSMVSQAVPVDVEINMV